MKKALSLICVVVLLFTLTACKNDDKTTINQQTQYTDTPQENVSSAIDITQITISETDSSNNVSDTQDEPVISEPTNDQTDVPVVDDTASVPSAPSQSSETVSVLGVTVNDPENTRGLSDMKYGFSYGVAKDGKPHNQSVVNQKTFDDYDNVSALALDTKTDEKIMYLTFDNGYEYQNLTADILDTLKEKNVKVTFFITLDYAKKNKELVQRMIDEGHIVGNHSTTHPVFPDITRTQMAEEIITLDNYLKENFSYTSPYFRFPTGAYSENSLELVTSLGYNSVFWSVAHSDWDTNAQKGADVAFDTVTSRFHPGAVILLHAVSSDNAQALGQMIDYAHSEGYTFATLDDYFNK